jgi:hypothetical protein
MATLTGDSEFDSKVTSRYVPAGHRQQRRRRAISEETLTTGIRERMADPERERLLDKMAAVFGDWGQ